MKKELKHLKWRLINQEGLSPEEADKRIALLEETLKENRRKRSKTKRYSLNYPKIFSVKEKAK
jgi:hypothetical protein